MNWVQLFLRPDLLPLLLIAPAMGASLWALDHARVRRVEKAIGPRTSRLAADLVPGRRRARLALFTTGLFFALLAVLQPAWGEGTRRIERSGVDIVTCLDVSRSMLARDVPPSRLEAARRAIRQLAGNTEGDRMALVLFAGAARLAVPLTRDVESLADIAGISDPYSVSQGGSDIGAALDIAMRALQNGSGKHEVIVLLTDGEDLEESGLRAARACAERGIRVHCVGIGSPRGAKIPIDAGDGLGERFLRDRDGTDVVSTMDPARLTRIAGTTGGAFVSASRADGLYERQIAPMERKLFEARERRERKNRYQWPLLAAFICWIVELCLGDRRQS